MIRKLLSYSCLFGALCTSVVTHAQTITTLAGNGVAGYSGDGVDASTTSLNNPYGVAVDVANGNVYIADYANHRIRKVDGTTNIITTIAGTGAPGYSGDSGPATNAQIQYPRGITVDPSGNVVFSDYGNNRVRKINMTTGVITTIAGVGGPPGYSASEDGGPATNAQLAFAWGVVYDAAGVLYIADNQNCRVRKVSTTGIISTFAGNGNCFISGDGGPATAARLQYPTGVGVDNYGNVYIADDGNNRVRKVNSSGIISTIAGSPTYGYSGDGGPSTAAKLYLPRAVATDAPGNVYICDMNNNRIRKINIFGIISTYAGDGNPTFGGDGGLPTDASINQTTGIAIDPSRGKYYICDNDNNRIRVINTFHNPYFTNGRRQVLSICEDGVKNMDTALAVDDIDVAETETWTLLTAPAHGAAMVTYVTSSTGTTIMPTGLSYTPTVGYSGSDSFKVRIFDGALSDTTTIIFNVLPLSPDAGIISGGDTVCPGFQITLSSTDTTGVWGSLNDTIATVNDTTGVVTGIRPGIDTITYTVTTVCGSTTIYHPVVVNDTSVCPGVGTPIINKNSEQLVVFPNPNSGKFSVKLISAGKEETTFTIINLNGEKVRRITAATNTSIDIDLEDLPSGIYNLFVANEHNYYSRKIVLTR